MKDIISINTNIETPQVNPITEPTPIPPTPTNHVPRKTHKNKLLPLFILFMLAAGIAISMLSMNASQDTRSRATVTGTKLSISPATKTAIIGETVTLGITINTDTDTVSAAELHLSYDPTAIQILSFAPGTILPVILTPETHVNGAISVTIGAQPSSPFKGAGIVGTWTIKILAAKQSSLNFASSTQVAALGKNTNALVSSIGSSITGTAGTGSTPTPTVPHANTPTPTNPPQHTPTPTPTRAPSSTPTPTNTPAPTPIPEVPTATSTPQEKTNPPYNTSTPIPTRSIGFGSIVLPTPIDFVDQTIPTPTIEEPLQQTAPLPEITVVTQSKTSSLTVFDKIFIFIVDFFKNLFQSSKE